MKLSRAFIIILLFICAFSSTLFVHADTASDLQTKIENHNNTVKQLKAEIEAYQAQIDTLGKQADSLKNTLTSLTLSRKKIETGIALTQDKITSTNLEIKNLSIDITDKSNRIGDGKRVISQSLYSIGQIDSTSLFETLLGSKSLAEVWNSAEELNILQGGVKSRIEDLQTIKTSLEDNKKKTESKKAELLSLKKDLSNQTQVIAETVKEQNHLLSSTKNTESNYVKIVAEKKMLKDQFEAELFQYESALHTIIDPSNVPHTGKGILAYPVDDVFITQYFGNTPFATANPQGYSGKGHNGIDFRASIGTPVKSADSGVIEGMGNTDLTRSCYSYGKWILVRHSNGLSTLYGHLSLQLVQIGNTVTRGQTIGYSGNTGYTTGPHLHFGVYVTEAIQVTKLTTSTHCNGITIPVSAPNGYLNPLSYL